MTINPQRAQALFLAALELSEPAARRELLDRECAGDAPLRQRVDELLKAHFDSQTFLGEPEEILVQRRKDAEEENLAHEFPRPGFRGEGRVRGLRPKVDHDETADPGSIEFPGTIVAGKYKLLEQIGEGGMGSVWLAEQKEPIKRKVAVKLIKAGMDSKSVLARFEAERQALALMDHPNIAKVFDGGMTEEGRPFFVMEFVKGVPFTEYCDQARLSLKERLNLFTPVCQAVQHAHQKGIIHRDLKPSNILICLYDGKPIPKVIDFGLAKAMHQSLTEQSLYTAVGMMVGTPLYMSPEQAEHNNLDVDTRTDIYSLGVILYELLTGSTPLEKQQLKEAAYNEILRLIKEVDPPKPSTRLSELSRSREPSGTSSSSKGQDPARLAGSAFSLASVAAQRSIDPKQLCKSLTGDLDWIVMKALDKERSRRYETANGLARDIERYLNDEAVEACPPSTTYRLKKLLRRNKGTVLAASLVLLALVAGTAAVLAVQARANSDLRSVNNQLDQANTELKSSNTLLDQQRARAEEREQQAIDAVTGFGDAVSINEELKNNLALESLRKTLLNEPLAFFKDLRERLQADADTRPESLDRLATASFDLGKLTNEIGDKQDALIAYRESLAIMQKLADANFSVTKYQSGLARSHYNIGILLSYTGKPAEALEAYELALAIGQKLSDANPTETQFQSHLAACQVCIGVLLSDTGKPAEALEAYESALAIQQKLADTNPTVTQFQSDLALSHNNIGNLLSDTGKPAEALEAYELALAIQQKLSDANPTETQFRSQLALSHNNIGEWLRQAGKPVDALQAYELALAIQQKLADANPTVTRFQNELALSHNNIGNVLSATGKPGEALEAHESALAIWQRLADANPTVTEFQSNLASSHNNIVNFLNETGKPGEALEAYKSALAIWERLATEHPESPDYANSLGGLLNNMAVIDLIDRRFDAARDRLQQAIVWQKKALAANPRNPEYRQFLTNHLTNLIAAARGLDDAEGVAEAERELAELRDSDPAMIALDVRLTEIVKGDQQPADNPERLALALRAYEKSFHALAARFFAEALAADAKLADDRQTQIRYNAACVASLAGCGKGKDDPAPDDEAKTLLRQQALAWLKAELATWTTLLASANESQRAAIATTLEHWKVDSDLGGIRDAEGLDTLPEAERESWKAFWTQVDELLAKATAQPDKDQP